MAKIKVDIDIHENSYDNSGDGELLGMVDESSFGSTGGNCHISQSYLDSNEEENNSSYHFKEIPSAVTYKIVQMPSGGDSTNNVSANNPTRILPANEFYVIGNPVEVFGTTPQKKLLPKDPLQSKMVTSKKRDDKRRATHNEVERRRRDKINSWITKLAALVPNSGLPDSASKGGILAKACDYITDLTERQKKLEKLEVDNDKLVLEILRLNQEIADLRKENTSMRNQLADNCIVVHRTKTERS